ncbi:hypothetical protein GCM10007924_25230 [Sneathiella chinensis]|uniref:Secreted peptide n=1 Tax=Sneathiella chinensis TaxID=349750 RepID=A0ABQ5U7L6_9PROT|nr:hypothetical protein GCM10007924_25230 [Sneathiella chinensis]
MTSVSPLATISSITAPLIAIISISRCRRGEVDTNISAAAAAAAAATHYGVTLPIAPMSAILGSIGPGCTSGPPWGSRVTKPAGLTCQANLPALPAVPAVIYPDLVTDPTGTTTCQRILRRG